jgi:GT2 family glycosyltransferase
MSNFAIGIPTLNRWDLLKEVIHKYLDDFKDIDIYIIDNGKQNIKNEINHKNIIVHEPDYNYGVAKSWNLLCNTIFQYNENALILNDDIYLGYGTDVVENAIKKSKVGIIQSEKNWCVICINQNLFEMIGDFDEVFYPAYYEDSDYLYRMKLEGIRQDVDATLNPLIFRASQTYEKNPELVNEAMQNNRLRYIKKWGNSPLLEIYTKPYNSPNLI